MGLTERLMRSAARRPHVLVVPVPGHAPTLWAAQDALDVLGWPRAASPAGADVLLSCGPLGTDLASHVDVAWEAMPGPRVRTALPGAGQAPAVLAAAAASLADLAAQRRDVVDRPVPRLSAADGGGAGEHSDAADAAHGESRHDETDHDDRAVPAGGMAEGMNTAGMDHSMHMTMDLPGGLTMADRVEDRDGLRLEGLRLSLGPLLPAWPAGLCLDVVLSGDVLVEADVRHLDPQPEPHAAPEVRALDALALLLEAAGWQDGALRARRARAERGSGPATAGLLRRLRRARLLRWSMRRLPGPGGTDLATHLDRLTAVIRGGADLPGTDVRTLTGTLVGLDVGTAHLVVAAHGPLLAVPAHG